MMLCRLVVHLDRNIYKILTVQIRNRRSYKGEHTPWDTSTFMTTSFAAPTRAAKKFDKPTVLTDTSTIPRQSYYACPHCMSKLDIITEGTKVVDVRAVGYPPTVLDSPAKCAHFSGLMNSLPQDAPLSDECLVCPKVLQCNIRKK
jgi:hypothetical protein